MFLYNELYKRDTCVPFWICFSKIYMNINRKRRLTDFQNLSLKSYLKMRQFLLLLSLFTCLHSGRAQLIPNDSFENAFINPGAGVTWPAIPSSNSKNLQPKSIAETTFYRWCVRELGCVFYEETVPMKVYLIDI